MRFPLLATALTLSSLTLAHAQWQIQDARTTADLRGIDYVGNGVAWASGTNGTVLRTEDLGFVWQLCATPPGAEKLDFRGVQAFDNNTAIVMSSGKGNLSRLYKTTDGCQTWKLVFTNPDENGFWDAISINAPSYDALGHKLDHTHAWGYLLGDPVAGEFTIFGTGDGGETWHRRNAEKRDPDGEGCKVDPFPAMKSEGAFAASNESILTFNSGSLLFITGGPVARLGFTDSFSLDGALCHNSARFVSLPIVHASTASGAFGMAAMPIGEKAENYPDKLMIVGGDYEHPDAMSKNAVLVNHPEYFFRTFTRPITPPNGYRSAVAYDKPHNTWITVGPNGTDISTDDGRNWRALKPGPGDAPDADSHWNALSLPFVVGPHGRVGILRGDVLKPAAAAKSK